MLSLVNSICSNKIDFTKNSVLNFLVYYHCMQYAKEKKYSSQVSLLLLTNQVILIAPVTFLFSRICSLLPSLWFS